MTRLRLLAPLAALVLVLTACGGSGNYHEQREALVEVSSTPSGQPIELQLNNTKLDLTTPDTRVVPYVTFCVVSPTDLVTTCHLSASVNFKLAAGRGSLTLCVAEGQQRECGASNQGSVVVTLDSRP